MVRSLIEIPIEIPIGLQVNLNVGDYDARTALHLAASNGCLEATSWLLQQESVDKSPVDRVLGTPLSDALRHNRTVRNNAPSPYSVIVLCKTNPCLTHPWSACSAHRCPMRCATTAWCETTLPHPLPHPFQHHWWREAERRQPTGRESM
jgi:hypothetical protein